ncbi:Josephin-domain-containing protein [Lentinus tigrinus ALCF2SS1-6]|uniref:ubiquitinyl hydrolase 1 n=1 Tax=Lentinus tigrinus ALCF2SS1-6 TaxID=1328759 RepID=A0A5C2RVT3_9APHY|nr:Josephin-domain-containing protein [Lentinus tigrinus ALCF2SS1-6]
MASQLDLIPLIYHEKQQPGEMLCAQHALNSLLREFFSAPDLSEIARELDEVERRELDEEERAQTSNNMDDTGFFSVQVLQKALSDSFNLTLVPWGAEELRPYHDHPHTQMAFILNHAQHWYTIRRFGNVSPDPALEADPGGGHWFNLNSFNDAPERIGKLYLGMFLQQAQQEGYSIFAVIQRDIEAPIALPRVEADQLFATIPEEAAGNFSYNYSATRSSSSAHGIEGFEDEDMELQAALQASLAGGDYGEYIPQRIGGISAHAPQQPPSRTSSGVPIQRDPEIIEPDEDEDEDDDFEMRGGPEVEPMDPVAASMARQRAVMERMRRAQEYALQNTYENEAAEIEALARMRQARRGADEEDEDEMLRRAIAESEAMARAQGSGQGSQEEDDDAPAPAPALAQSAPPAWHQHRVYDDEDQELQAALRASLETVPPGFRVPSPPPIASSRSSPSEVPTPPAQSLQPPAIKRQPSSESIKTESETDAPEPEPELSPEEIRRRRIARFGG